MKSISTLFRKNKREKYRGYVVTLTPKNKIIKYLLKPFTNQIQLNLYIDGELIYGETQTIGTYYKGQLSNIMKWNRTVKQEEIKKLHKILTKWKEKKQSYE